METLEDHVTKCNFATATCSTPKDNRQFLTRPSTKGNREEGTAAYTNCELVQSNPSLGKVKNDGKNERENDEYPHVYDHVYENQCTLRDTPPTGYRQDTVSKCIKEISELKTALASMQRVVDALKTTQCILRDKEVLVVTVAEFASKKTSSTSFLSQMFYAYHSGGYKMRLQVFPGGNKEGRGSHVSVLVRLVKGPCDNKLRWPFAGTVTIQLLNQLADENHVCRQVSCNKSDNKFPGSDVGVNKFITHSELCSSSSGQVQYLRDDTIHFMVGVVNNRKAATLV